MRNYDNRSDKLQLSNNEFKAGEIGAQFNVAIIRIARIASGMNKSNIKEPTVYHWVIVAHLMTFINSTLVATSKSKPKKENIKKAI